MEGYGECFTYQCWFWKYIFHDSDHIMHVSQADQYFSYIIGGGTDNRTRTKGCLSGWFHIVLEAEGMG